MMMKRIQLSILLLFILNCLCVYTQEEISPQWTAEFSKSKTFIENKGQFDQFVTSSTGQIKFAVDFGSTRIFFGEKGVSYNFLEILKQSKEERAEIAKKPAKSFQDHKQKEQLYGKFLVKSDQVNMTWEHANTSVEIEGIGATDDYHSYTFSKNGGPTENINYIKGFKRIIYRNIYPHIDIEYDVHPIIGVKYAYIINPGADPSMIKMLFDRDISFKNGELIINTQFGDIIDHAPITFYKEQNDNIIKSEYNLNGRQVSFSLQDFDPSQTIVIDPWVQTPVFPSNWDCVWELDTDAAGNVYIIGGVTPLQLKKYNSAGVLQWTHNTPYDTTSWLGTMATDDLGNTYVTNGTDYKIQKINTAGGLVWNNNSPSGGQISTEFWNISFNCDQTKLIVGGTGGNLDLHGKIYEVNMNSGNITNSVVVSANGNLFAIPPSIQEVRAMTAAPNGKYYFLTLDTIGYMSDNLSLCPGGTSSLNRINHSIGWGYKCENWRYNNTGIKAIRADANFVYVHKGNQLQKRSLVDFSLIGSVAIPGGTLQSVFLGGNVSHNAGIDIDDCGNIYVGSTNGVYKFNSSLTQLASYPTAFIVYDVRVNSGGEVVACGGTGNSSNNTRSGGVQSFAASACAPIAITCCNATICLPPAMCSSDSPITLTAASAGGTWSGNGVNASGIFDPSIAGAGTHTITYTLPCGSESISITVNPCLTLDVCEETNGSLTVSGGTPTYTWYTSSTSSSTTPINTEAECIACAGATPQYLFGFYTGCSQSNCTTTTTTWTAFGTGSNQTVPSYPVQIIDGNGTEIIINSAAGLVACNSNPCPTITLSTSSQTNVLCFGNSTGAATVSASGGNGTYTYTWNPGALNGASQSNLTAGTYTINVVDGNACPGSGTVTITQPASALTVGMASTPTNCGANTGTATATPSGGTGSYSYVWSPSGGNANIASNLASGPYSVLVTDGNSCQVTGNVSVSANGGPTISVTGSTDATCFGDSNGSATVSGSGGTGTLTYNWMPGSMSGATQNALSANTYTVTVTDQGGCSNSTTVTIGEPAELILTSGTITAADCGSSNGSASVTGSGGTGSLNYTWNPNVSTTNSATNIDAGSYTITVQDQNSCSESINIVVPSIGGPTVSLLSSTDASCFGDNDGEATIDASGGTSPYTYAWSPTGGNTPTAINLSSGTYTVTVTDDAGCIGTTTVTINEPAPIAITETITPSNCGSNNGSISTIVTGGSSSYSYLWSPNGEITSPLSSLPAGSYSLTVTDDEGCSSTENYIVSTTGSLTITVSPISSTIQEGETVQLNAFGATSYTWSPSEGLDNPNISNPIASPTITTIYTVTGTDDSGCVGTASLTVFVEQNCGEIFVPTIFSPNGVGPNVNNTLCIYGNCISELKYAIYNRWGEKVFETTDPVICWDGTYKNKELNSGVYAYKLIVQLYNGTYLEQSGNVTLVR